MKKTSLIFSQMKERLELRCCQTCPLSSKGCANPCTEARREIYGTSPFRNMVLKLSDLIFMFYCLVFRPKQYAFLRELLKRRGFSKVLSRLAMLLVIVFVIVLSIVSVTACSPMRSIHLDLKLDYGAQSDSASVTLRRLGRTFIADSNVCFTLPRKDIKCLYLNIGNERFSLPLNSNNSTFSMLSRSPISDRRQKTISLMCGLQDGKLVPLRNLNDCSKPLLILSTSATERATYINQ